MKRRKLLAAALVLAVLLVGGTVAVAAAPSLTHRDVPPVTGEVLRQAAEQDLPVAAITAPTTQEAEEALADFCAGGTVKELLPCPICGEEMALTTTYDPCEVTCRGECRTHGGYPLFNDFNADRVSHRQGRCDSCGNLVQEDVQEALIYCPYSCGSYPRAG